MNAPRDGLGRYFFVVTVLLDKVKHLDELRENENLLALLQELREELVEENHFPGLVYEILDVVLMHPELVDELFFDLLDQVRVDAALPELDLEVDERGFLALVQGIFFGQDVEVPVVHSPVDLLLEIRKLDIDDDLLETRNRRFDVRLLPSHDVLLENFLELCELVGPLQVSELIYEPVPVRKRLRVYQVQQTEDFLCSVLNRCSW